MRTAACVATLMLILVSSEARGQAGGASCDVVVYGGTSAGVAAAVQVKRMGKTVVLIEPTQRLGGLTTGGLGQTDIGNKAAIGGIAREFYERVRKYYEEPAAWKWQKASQYLGGGQTRSGKTETAMWTFEPQRRAGDRQRNGARGRGRSGLPRAARSQEGREERRPEDRRHRHGVRAGLSRANVPRRQLRRRFDGGRGRFLRRLAARPTASMPKRSTASR